MLLVEDSDLSIEQVRGWLAQSSPDCELLTIGDRDTAVATLEAEGDDFDLIICDLNIPPRVDSLDGREEYGLQVHQVARQHHRGTPSLFFTGHADDIDTHDELSLGGVEDIYGTGELVPLVRLIRKLYAERAGEYIAIMSAEIDELDHIELRDRGTRPVSI